jgi:hypothetical protein
MNYSSSLIGAPFRWYDSELDSFNGTDKFWCENSPAPSPTEINENDSFGTYFNHFCLYQIRGHKNALWMRKLWDLWRQLSFAL